MRSQETHSNVRNHLLLFIAVSAATLLCPSSAHASDPCCEITAIDARTGVVTARVNASGQTFQFSAGSALRQLRLGQSIYANLATKQVSVNGLVPCCQIINVGVAPVDGVRSPAQSTATLGSSVTSSAAGGTLGAQAAKGAVNPGTPCCDITGINSSTGVVTAQVKATGQSFQFNAGSMLSQLHVGQNIYANLVTKQVSVNGAGPCCDIINVGASPIDGVRSPAQSTTLGSSATSSAAGSTLGAQAAKGAVNPGTPCCDITGINSSTGVVTAQVKATGQSFQFNAGSMLSQLHVGQNIYANLVTKQVSVNGLQPCCSIINLGASPSDGVRSPAQSTTLGGSATSSAVGSTSAAQAAKGAVNPGQPCCNIAGINTATGVVTAQVNATGQSFQFNMNNATQLQSLHVGQGVYANFKSNHVSLDGKHSTGKIVSSGAAAASQSTTSSQTGSTQPPGGGAEQPKYARANGSAVGGPTVFGGNETLEEATRKCQATCDAEGQQHNPPMACTADVAQTNPGQYSCSCKCDQVGSGTDGSKSGGITTSGGPTVGNTLSAPAAPANTISSTSTAAGIGSGSQPVADFSVAFAPNSPTSAPQGTNATYILNLTRIGNFNGEINLGGKINGVQYVAINPAAVSLGCSTSTPQTGSLEGTRLNCTNAANVQLSVYAPTAIPGANGAAGALPSQFIEVDGTYSHTNLVDGLVANTTTISHSAHITLTPIGSPPPAGPANSLPISSIMINEFGPYAQNPQHPRFIELYNASTQSYDLKNYSIAFRAVGQSSDTMVASFSKSTPIAANGFYLLTGMFGAQSGMFLLKNNVGTAVDAVAFGGTQNPFFSCAGIAFSPFAAGANYSLARIPNGANTNTNQADFAITRMTTPGAANQLSQ